MKKLHREKLNDLLSCDFCDKKFFQKKNLKIHLESFQCKNQKIFTCDHCGKEFDEKKKIYSHIQIHAIHKVECNICHAQFKLKSLFGHSTSCHNQKNYQLNQHMKYHENPEHFKCQICGHQSTQKGNLKTHLRIHDKNREKNFKCNQCDFKTYWKESLRKHLKIHENNKKSLK
jgi:KRAB domain-containing zinc finger protein